MMKIIKCTSGLLKKGYLFFYSLIGIRDQMQFTIICEKSHNRIKSEALIHHDTMLDGDIIERL